MAKSPSSIQGYAQHGALLSGSGEWRRGPCPLCGSQTRNPFAVKAATSAWSCKSCGGGGGLPEFLEAAMRKYQRAMRGAPMIDLERQRGIPRGALRRWGVGWAAVARSWALPSRINGRVVNVTLWRPDRKGLGTKGGKAGLLYAWDSANPVEGADTVWVCEGEWDAMVMDHVLRTVGAERTAVLGVTGADSRPAELLTALTDKHVVLAYDNDDAGRAASEKTRALVEQRCASVRAIAWPADVRDGHDVRDLWLDSGRKATVAWKKLATLYKEQAPRAPLHASAAAPAGRGLSRRRMISGFREWLHLPDPTVLDVVFGVVFANRLGGTPVWLFLVGPGGCGKTVPIQALFGAPMIVPVDTMTPPSLISGSKDVGMGDPSQIPRWNDKVVAMKDFTSVLSLPQSQRELIFGYLRSAFDGRIDKTFGNSVERHYRPHFGIIAGVTPEIERYGPQQSVVGERFLRLRVRDDLVVAAGSEAIDTAVDVVVERQENVRTAKLAEIARATLDREVKDGDWPTVGKGLRVLFRQLAQWTAAMRGAVPRNDYTHQLDYAPQAEIGTRLATQLIKLAMGVAVLRRKGDVGHDEFKVAVRVARDSAPNLRDKVARELWVRKSKTLTASELSDLTRLPHETIDRVLGDGFMLRVFRKTKQKGSSVDRWGLTQSLMRLMEPLELFVK